MRPGITRAWMCQTEITSVNGDNLVEQVDPFEDLLPTLARGLDIRDFFQHLSAVFSRIVPHDEANLAVLTGDGDRLRLYATTRESAAEVPAFERTAPIADSDRPRLWPIMKNCSLFLSDGPAIRAPHGCTKAYSAALRVPCWDDVAIRRARQRLTEPIADRSSRTAPALAIAAGAIIVAKVTAKANAIPTQ